MKKFLKALALAVALGVAFLLGWRVMPRVWPTLKAAVVYPLFPALQPAPQPTAVPYAPAVNAALGQPIAPTDSLIYYFYRPTCPYCAALEPLISGLPTQITLPDGRVSQVKLVGVNKSDEAEGAVIARYYEQHAVDEQYVPALLIGERYLCPGNEIIDALLDALMNGEGLATPLLDGNTRE